MHFLWTKYEKHCSTHAIYVVSKAQTLLAPPPPFGPNHFLKVGEDHMCHGSSVTNDAASCGEMDSVKGIPFGRSPYIYMEVETWAL